MQPFGTSGGKRRIDDLWRDRQYGVMFADNPLGRELSAFQVESRHFLRDSLWFTDSIKVHILLRHPTRQT